MGVYEWVSGCYSLAMTKTYTVHTPADFQTVVAAVLAASAANGLTIALTGDLGAGKTTFTQVFAKYLGVIEPVTSPTFTIMKQYPLEHERFDRLVHIDAYRFESEEEASPLRLEEVFAAPRTVTCVEWPERISSYLPAETIHVQIALAEGETRKVEVVFPDGE